MLLDQGAHYISACNIMTFNVMTSNNSSSLAILLIAEATPMKVQEERLPRATRVMAPSNTGSRAKDLDPSREKWREAESPTLAAGEQHL